MKRLLLVIQLGLIAITCNVNASIINFDTDDYNAYKDTDTGLVWLDFGQNDNHNKSFNYVASQLGTGGEWEGWRLPTSSEVYTMWANVADLDNVEADYESPNPYGPGTGYFSARSSNSDFSGADDSVWDDVFGMIGYNLLTEQTAFSKTESFGFFEGTTGISHVVFTDLTDKYEDDANYSDDITYNDGENYDEFASGSYPQVSTLLVRRTDSPPTDLPAPSTIAILGLGLLGLVARRKLF